MLLAVLAVLACAEIMEAGVMSHFSRLLLLEGLVYFHFPPPWRVDGGISFPPHSESHFPWPPLPHTEHSTIHN